MPAVSSLARATASYSTTVLFSDNACTQPAYQVHNSQVAAAVGHPVAFPLPREGCEPVRYGVGILSLIEIGELAYGGPNCEAQNRFSDFSVVQLKIDSVEAPEQWGKGTSVEGPTVSDRLLLRQFETEDGTRFNDRLIDQQWSKPCTLYFDSVYANPAICEPQFLYGPFNEREGSDCMGTELWRTTACSDPVFIRDTVDGEPTSFLLGTQWTGEVSANYGHGGCQPLDSAQTSIDGLDRFFELGERVTVATATASFKLKGEGRLQLKGMQGSQESFVSLDGLTLLETTMGSPNLWSVPRYFDTVTNQDCDLVWAPDGSVRCVSNSTLVQLCDLVPVTGTDTTTCAQTSFTPSLQRFWGLFGDPACSKPAYECRGAVCDEGGPVITMAPDSAGTVRATSLNAAHYVTSVYMQDFAGCNEIPGLGTPGSFVLGEALSWDDYPELQQVNGPPQ